MKKILLPIGLLLLLSVTYAQDNDADAKVEEFENEFFVFIEPDDDSQAYWVDVQEGEEGAFIVTRRGGDRRLGMMKMWHMADYLELSESQEDELYPLMRKHQKARDAWLERRQKVIEAYMDKLDDGKVSARDIDKYLKDIQKLDEEHLAMRQQHQKDMMALLDDQQKAKFVVFDEKMKHQIKTHIRMRSLHDGDMDFEHMPPPRKRRLRDR